MRPIGIDLSHWIEHWSQDLLPILERAKACGFDGAELAIIDPFNMNFHALRQELVRLDMRVTCGAGLTPSADISSPDAGIRQAGMEKLKRCVEGCQLLGSNILGGVLYAPWMRFPETYDLQPYRDRSAAALRLVGQVAGDLGVTLCLEVINRFEANLFNTVDDGLAFLQQVDSPHVKLHLDTFHMNIEEDDLAQAIRTAGRALGHLHCASNSRRRPGLGHIDWRALKVALDEIDYQHWLVIETFPRAGNQVGNTVRTWRALGGDLDEEARLGAAFLRQSLC